MQFTGVASVSGTNAGTYNMNLASTQFTNISPNFTNCEFVVYDGQLIIDPVSEKVTVPVIGHNATHTYDSTEKTVAGYDVGEISNPLYKSAFEADSRIIGFSGSAEAKGTNASTDAYKMNLNASQFSNKNGNFSNVDFDITDGWLKINPITETVTVSVAENTGTANYDGNEHTVEGYKITNISNSLYKAVIDTDYTFSGIAVAKGTTVQDKAYAMGLESADFENKNTNFANVEFSITLGGLTILPSNEQVVVTITGNNKIETYDGTPKELSGYTAEVTLGSLYTNDDFQFTGTTEDIKATGTDAGTYNTRILKSHFSNTNKNFYDNNITFEITQGTLLINKRDLKITTVDIELIYNGEDQFKNVTDTAKYEGLVDGETIAYLNTNMKTVGSYIT
ncbi:MAG: hypothetical protein HUJ62_08480, partial [Streptococcus gallolyticus]|nr:hypothetical protein [Streptococcus gallolyticus]